jgi:hypothetical protein
MRRTWYQPTTILLSAILVSGCSSGIYPVEGQVVWKDGSPAKELAGSQVVFELEEANTSARGTVQADGSFRLTTNKPDDGALPGEHKVIVMEVGLKPLGGPDASAIAPGVMDSRFSDLSTSDLTAEVKPGTNRVTLTVERAGKQ